MDIEPLCLVARETAGDGLKRPADLIEMVQAFPQTEVGEVGGTEFVAQKRRELFILLEECVLEIGAAILSAVSRHRPSSQLRSNSL